MPNVSSACSRSASQVPVIGVRGAKGPGVADFDELASGPPLPESEFAALEPDDPVTILYTSGTTGHPKGALGTNRATIANLLNMGFGSAPASRSSAAASRESPYNPRRSDPGRSFTSAESRASSAAPCRARRWC